MSSHEESSVVAPSVTRRRLESETRPPRKISPPWMELLEGMKSPSISMYRVYQRAGITKSRRYWLSRTPDLRVSVAYRMALAAGVDPGRFMAALALRLGPEGLLPIPREGRKYRPPTTPRRAQRCSLCDKPGHNKRKCPSRISSAALLLRARGAAIAVQPDPKEK